MTTYDTLYHSFVAFLDPQGWVPPSDYQVEFNRIVSSIGFPREYTKAELESVLCRVITDKMAFYSGVSSDLIDSLAKKGIFLNYHEKLSLNKGLINNDLRSFISILSSKQATPSEIKMVEDVHFYSNAEVLKKFRDTTISDPNQGEVLSSIFAAFLYSAFEKGKIDLFYSGKASTTGSFYGFLKGMFPEKYDRSHALSVLYIDKTLLGRYNGYESALTAILSYIRKEYNELQNYCYMSIILDDIKDLYGNSITWRLYSDIVLFACKFCEERLNIGYFHPEIIKKKTASYIRELDIERAQFDIANTGFTYKDCIVLCNSGICNEGEEIHDGYKILVLFQKNKRDEDIIPCPACKSEDVRGNSYPVLGVKSWECHNPLCPDKSKYNRGKRYSMSSIIKQEAIEDARGAISKEFLNEWRLDVVGNKGVNDALEYLAREYSFVGDTIVVSNIEAQDLFNRHFISKGFDFAPDLSLLSFFDSAYFHRFAIEGKAMKPLTPFENISHVEGVSIFNGNCQDVLATFPDSSFDGAVTSPPYYNAKEYSHWENIYCYLYDMQNHARQVFRTLRPGAYYLYNIFDYFDNENNVVLSAMGQGRMILGAYIIYLFRRVGFEIQDNIIWYKGHIQGHRSTNQGNNSPYYQAPLNCYEHVLCFRKPGSSCKRIEFPSVANIYPVIKMVKGRNVLGHSAPFPLEIPRLLIKHISSGCILEPYSGSFTTARAAKRAGLSSVNIEMSKEYCDLGISLLEQEGYTLF